MVPVACQRNHLESAFQAHPRRFKPPQDRYAKV